MITTRRVSVLQWAIVLALVWTSASVFAAGDATKPDIDGVVNNPNGTPCAGIQVAWTESSMGPIPASYMPMYAITDAHGVFHFDGDKAWAHGDPYGCAVVQVKGYAVAGEMVQRPNASPSFLGDPGNIAITLGPSTAVHLHVVDSHGKPVPSVRLHATYLEYDTADYKVPPKLVDLASNKVLRGGLTVATDGHGNAIIPDMPQGWFVHLQIDDDEFAPLTSLTDAVFLATAAVTTAPPLRLTPATSIEGRVVFKPTGQPAPHVLVTAFAARTAAGDMMLTAVTGNDGRYRIARAPAGSYHLELTVDKSLGREWTSHPVSFCSVTNGQRKQGVNFAIFKGAIITGTVTFAATDTPASGVVVDVEDENPLVIPGAEAITDANGRYRACVPGGEVRVSLNTHSPYKPNPCFVDVQNGRTATADFTMHVPLPQMSVQGTVADSHGNPVAGAVVTPCALSFFPTAPETTSDPEGKFVLNLPLDQPIVVLTARNGNSITPQEVIALGGDNVTLRLVDSALGQLAGSVVDQRGQPIVGAKVRLTQHISDYEDTQPASAAGVTTSTDIHGNYSFENIVPYAICGLVVSAPKYQGVSRSGIPIQPGGQTKLDKITLALANRSIAGKVVGSNGKPLQASISVNSAYDESITTDRDGKFRIDGLARGQVRLLVSTDDEIANVRVMAGDEAVKVMTHSKKAQMALYQARGQQIKAAQGKEVPVMNVASWFNSSPLTMADLRGKYVLFNFWTDASPDCLITTEEIGKALADRGVIVIGVAESDLNLDAADVKAFIASEHLTLPVGIDSHDRTATSLGVDGSGYFALVDRKGKVVGVYPSYDLGSDAFSDLGHLLMEEQVRSAK